MLRLNNFVFSGDQPLLTEFVRQPLPGLPRVTPGYSIGLISVRQPEPGLRWGNPVSVGNTIVG